MNEEQTRDISDTINEIIDQLGPLYEKKLEEGGDGVVEFIAALFGAITKLCGELNIDRENGELFFHHMWDVMEKKEKRDLN
jgi:hypothetical protein